MHCTDRILILKSIFYNIIWGSMNFSLVKCILRVSRILIISNYFM